NEYRLCGRSFRTVGIEHDEAQPRVRRLVPCRRAEPLHREALDGLPVFAVVGAALQAVVPRTEEQDARVVRIDREALAEPAPVLVAAHAERNRKDLPRL